MIPNAKEKIGIWRDARRRSGRMLLALDFDGTLAPIAERPDGARMPVATRAILARLAARPDTDVAVVSGRALEDVRGRVGLEDIYYSGNHGLEIEGPGIRQVHREAAAAAPRISHCADTLRRALAPIQGVVVEDKGITLSVHYRLVSTEEDAARVRSLTHAICAGREGLRITEGLRVLEVRPDVDWDKGRATRFLLNALGMEGPGPAPAIFVGDDRTDEDAFRTLRGRGDGVLVAASPPEDTAATAVVRSTEEVVELLEALAATEEADRT